MAGPRARRIVIGIGNPDRGDDGAGRAVAKALDGTLPPDVELVEHGGEAMSLLALIEDAAEAYLIDACTSDAPAGTVRRFDVTERPLPPDAAGMSTHGAGLAQAIELARALDALPARCVVHAITGNAFTAGAPLSPAVAAAVAVVAERVRSELAESGTPDRDTDNA